MLSSKRGEGKSGGGGGGSSHVRSLHQRLRDALKLGTGFSDGGKVRWECKDIEIQRHVLRAIAAFVDAITRETRHDPLVKDSVSEIIGALVEILQQKNGTVITIAADVVVKLVNAFTYSTLQPYVLELIHPLSSLSANHQIRVALSCAGALNLLISNLSKTKEKEVWEILSEANTIDHLMLNIIELSHTSKPVEYIQEAASLLSIILWRWPQSRYSVWSISGFMKFLEVMCIDPDPSIKVAALKLCSGIALCGYGAQKVIDNANLLESIIHCLGSSHPQSVQMEAFKLAQCIMMNEEGCSRVLSLYCELTVKAIIDAMSGWRLQEGEVACDRMLLLVEACRLATITRWPGKHHFYFWKMGIDKVLFDLLLPNLNAKHPSDANLSLEEQISIAQESLNMNSLFPLKPYIWDVAGYLAVHCSADFIPGKNRDAFHIEILLTCASLAFDDVIRKGRQLFLDDTVVISRTEGVVRAVQMMIYSSCKYISSKITSILSEILRPNATEYLDYLVYMLRSKSSRDNFGIPELLELVIHLICLTCYLALPSCWSSITSKWEGTMTDFVTRCLNRPYSSARRSYAFHLANPFNERICCWTIPEEWEGRNILLFYGLWCLAEVTCHSQYEDINPRQTKVTEIQFVSKLREICRDPSTGGARWFAAYILSFSGFFGFPSKLGDRIGEGRDKSDFIDIQLALSDGEKLGVHRVLLLVRCPSLLPPKALPSIHKRICAANTESDEPCTELQKEFPLSSHVGHSELVRLLDYVYCGYLQQVDESLLKKLKPLAQSCRLQHLSQLLSRRIPRWGSCVPSFDLSPALDLDGQRISDVILEAKTTDLSDWKCAICSASPVPHMHLHKVILWASCDYLRALLQSGMLESHSRVVKVPVSWEAMRILVKWFYSCELQEPPSGCLWHNMGNQEKLCHLEPFIQLLWLSEFWFLDQVVHEECLKIVMSRLGSDSRLSVKVLQVAGGLSQWKIVEAAVGIAAGSFRQLQESGELESLDDTLVEMVRAASVRFSQIGEDEDDNAF